MSIGIEETTCQIIAHVECRRVAQEGYGCIGRDALCAREHLESHHRALGLYDLCKPGIHNGKLVICHTVSLE